MSVKRMTEKERLVLVKKIEEYKKLIDEAELALEAIIMDLEDLLDEEHEFVQA